jgi:serine/threonine protein kinase
MCQLSRAFQYLQLHNIIHRDLKPQNILMTDDFQTLKLADFGMARSLDQNELAATMCGSPLYMAPEVLLKKHYSQKADLWSLGMIMYELLYGKHPFCKANNHFQLLCQIQTRTIHFNRRIKVSDNCLELLRSVLQKDADKRISWHEFFTHSWFIEGLTPKPAVVVPSPQEPASSKPMTYSQEVEFCMYGEFRIPLGDSDDTITNKTPVASSNSNSNSNSNCNSNHNNNNSNRNSNSNSNHNNNNNSNRNSNSNSNNNSNSNSNSNSIMGEDENEVFMWNQHIVDENYRTYSRSEPRGTLAYTILNPDGQHYLEQQQRQPSLGQSIASYMSASYDLLLRGSMKYFNSL